MRCVMDHIVLNVVDENAMITFYTEVLQFQTERLEEFRAGEVPFPSVRLNEDTIIDLFPKKMWEGGASAGPGRQNLNHFCITMTESEWRELNERLKADSIVIVDGPVPRWGAHGTGTSIYFHDPEANTIEARYYAYQPQEKPCLLGS